MKKCCKLRETHGIPMKEQYMAASELFRRTDGMLRRCIEKKLRTLEEEIYRSQHRLLMMLDKNPNCSQNELAAILEISPAAVAVSLGKLEKSGYIAREINTDDHRSNQVAITKKGDHVIQKSIRLFEEVECMMFEGFDEEEMKRFCASLQKACGNLERMQQMDSMKTTSQAEEQGTVKQAADRRGENEES